MLLVLLLLLSYKMYACVTSAFGQSDLKSTSPSLPRKVPIKIYMF